MILQRIFTDVLDFQDFRAIPSLQLKIKYLALLGRQHDQVRTEHSKAF